MTQKPTELADYSDVFGVEAGLPIPVIVGGQAANAWAIYYSKRIGRKLARYRPFTSKDLDITGNRELLEHIKRITKGTVFYSEPRSPVIGYVEASLGDGLRKIEVLRDVRGLARNELSDAIQVTVGKLVVHLLAPIKVLKAKLCNVVTLDQSDRNDVNHAHIISGVRPRMVTFFRALCIVFYSSLVFPAPSIVLRMDFALFPTARQSANASGKGISRAFH